MWFRPHIKTELQNQLEILLEVQVSLFLQNVQLKIKHYRHITTQDITTTAFVYCKTINFAHTKHMRTCGHPAIFLRKHQRAFPFFLVMWRSNI